MENNQPIQSPIQPTPVPIPPKNKPNWSPITFGIIIFAVGFIVGHSIPNNAYSYSTSNPVDSLVQIFVKPTPTLTPIPPTPTLSPSICKRITYPTASRSAIKDKYFLTYEVKAGDTLLSITKNQLGDVSRINELINLNKGQYPNLTQSSTLPAGTKLYITPKDYPENTGDLWIAEGAVTESDAGHFVLMISPSPNDSGEDITINSTTKYMDGIKSLKRGDCITVVIDYMGNYTHNALIIWPQ